MGYMIQTAVEDYWKKYAVFKGRASRSDFIISFLMEVVLFAVAVFIDNSLAIKFNSSTPLVGWLAQKDNNALYYLFPHANILHIAVGVWFIITLVPSYALAVRRLHGSNNSGWIILCTLIPYAGFILMSYYMLKPSDDDNNQYTVVRKE